MGISKAEFRTKIKALQDAQRQFNAMLERIVQGEVETAIERQPEDAQRETFGVIAEEAEKIERAIDRAVVKTAQRINSSSFRRLVRGVWKDPNAKP